jgi:hypothetical protein
MGSMESSAAKYYRLFEPVDIHGKVVFVSLFICRLDPAKSSLEVYLLGVALGAYWR